MRAKKCSIHILPCNVKKSESHNDEDLGHRNAMKHVHVKEKYGDNEHLYYVTNLSAYLDEIRIIVKEKTGQKLKEGTMKRKNKNGKIQIIQQASPIREGVISHDSLTNMGDLKAFSLSIEKKFGIKTLQIHTHKDEGHYDNTGVFIHNCHSHIIFDWIDHKTGKSIKLSKDDMSLMQDLLSEHLDLQRGESKNQTKVEHLGAIEFKTQKLIEEIVEKERTIQEQGKQEQALIVSISQKKKINKHAQNTVLNKIAGLLGRDKEINKFKTTIEEKDKIISCLNKEQLVILENYNNVAELYTQEKNKNEVLSFENQEVKTEIEKLKKQLKYVLNFLKTIRTPLRIIFQERVQISETFKGIYDFLFPYWKNDDNNKNICSKQKKGKGLGI